MQITVVRELRNCTPDSTPGEMLIDDQPYGVTLEDARRAEGVKIGFYKFIAGAKVVNPNHEYAPTLKNVDKFENLKAQAWQDVADRLRNTFNAVTKGTRYSANELISIRSELPFLDRLKDELCLPLRDYSKRGLDMVEPKKKLAERGFPSPNLADSFIMGAVPHLAKSSETQFIQHGDVSAAQARESGQYLGDDPLICGLSIARGEGGNCVISFRRGRDAKSEKVYKIADEKTRDSTKLMYLLVMVLDRHKPDVTFLDAAGVGGPILDRLAHLGYHVVSVRCGGHADDDKQFADKISEMAFKCRQWLMDGGSIQESQELEAELICREYGHDKNDRLLIERHDSVQSRIGMSPDWANSLYLTFAQAVPKRETSRGHLDRLPGQRVASKVDYNPLSKMR
jgi:hypothetical protein